MSASRRTRNSYLTDPASFDRLVELHRLVAETLLERVKSGKARASTLEVCRKFLADNGVDIGSIKSRREAAEALEEVIADLPFDTDPSSSPTDF